MPTFGLYRFKQHSNIRSQYWGSTEICFKGVPGSSEFGALEHSALCRNWIYVPRLGPTDFPLVCGELGGNLSGPSQQAPGWAAPHEGTCWTPACPLPLGLKWKLSLKIFKR